MPAFPASEPSRLSRRYTASFCLFFLVCFVVFFSLWLEPECDEAAAIAVFPKHALPFANAHYTPGCNGLRYSVLLFLSPRECDLGRRIVFAIVCGGAVGYERRRVDRPAGIRTMALVALGACVFTITSIFAFENGPMTYDSSRVAAAIPSGVGFLGAGLIWKTKVKAQRAGEPEKEEIHGLTTAASTWVAASCGIAAGGALYFVAAFSVLTLLFVLRFGPRTDLGLGSHASDPNFPRDAENPGLTPGAGPTPTGYTSADTPPRKPPRHVHTPSYHP